MFQLTIKTYSWLSISKIEKCHRQKVYNSFIHTNSVKISFNFCKQIKRNQMQKWNHLTDKKRYPYHFLIRILNRQYTYYYIHNILHLYFMDKITIIYYVNVYIYNTIQYKIQARLRAIIEFNKMNKLLKLHAFFSFRNRTSLQIK